MKSLKKEIDAFVRACREIARHELVKCSSGNLSFRLKGGLFLIKASRVWMENAGTDDVCVCSLDDGRVVYGRKPSAETILHLETLRRRPDMNLVLHFQAPFATALACRRGTPPNYNILPEIPFYIGPVAHVPYFPPGSRELARAASSALARHDMVQLCNHGQATVAHDFPHAIQNAVFFELACRAIILNGEQLRTIPRRLLPSKGDTSVI